MDLEGDTFQEVEDLVGAAVGVEEGDRKDAYQEDKHRVAAVVAELELVRRAHLKHFLHFLHFLLNRLVR